MVDKAFSEAPKRSSELFRTVWLSIMSQNFTSIVNLGFLLLLFLYLAHATFHRLFRTPNLPVVNRRVFFEPNFFSRLRFAFKATKILEDAYNKYKGRPYLLARGDADMIVLPASYIADLNKVPQQWLNMREFLCMTLSGSLNGMNAVLESGVHVKALLSRVSPLLPTLIKPMSTRIQESMSELLPQSTTAWTPVEPLQVVVHWVSQGITLATFGPPFCDDPELVKLCYEHTTNIFGIPFVMRFVPKFLQPILVWLLPLKWNAMKGWKSMRKFAESRIRCIQNDEKSTGPAPDIISWMLQDAKQPEKHDLNLLTHLIGTTMAGGTFSTAGLIVGVISGLLEDPTALEEIRNEIRDTHKSAKGVWDQAALNHLEKLDSAMKETLRVKPGSLLVYSREISQDFNLNGLKLRKGQKITTSGHSQAHDAAVFPDPNEFRALRAYNLDLEKHRAHPFRAVEGDDHRWGSGRWACPGRTLASTIGKIILAKLLDEYDFELAGGQQLQKQVVHDFVFMDPSSKIMIRRRATTSGIVY